MKPALRDGAAAAEHLCFGDLVYLLHDNDRTGGCAETQGFGEDIRLAIKTPATAAKDFAKRAVYSVWQQQTISHAIALRNALESGKTISRSDPQLLLLQQEAEKEATQNTEEFEMIKGNEVRYGMTVSLRHEGSGRFITVSASSSPHDPNAHDVVVSSAVGENMFFHLKPQLGRVHSEGERIHYDDPVQIGSVAHVGVRLNVSRRLVNGQTSFEVLAATESTGFKLACFRSVQSEKTAASLVSAPPLFGGQCIRLLHVEADGFGVHPYRSFACPLRATHLTY